MKEKDKSENLLKIIAWLDKKRWSSKTNYNIIDNDLFKNLSNSQKILVHWICYITDRQTPFARIWTDGGLVFSGMVKEYSKEDCGYNYLKEKIENKSNFIKEKEKIKKEDKKKFIFVYGKNKFASRFTTTDIKSILLAFRILEDYKKNIVSYVNSLYNKFCYLLDKVNESNSLNLIAFILHLLSYEKVKRDKDEEKSFVRYFEDVERYYLEIKKIINNQEEFEKKYSNFVETRFSEKKRTWCCIRDYLKSYFKDDFVNALKKEKNNEKLIEIFNDPNQWIHLELPGDVWNLNKTFAEKMLESNLGKFSRNKKRQFNKIPKELNEKLKEPYYPELFDLTFDFVPRMCAHPNNQINKTMCNICPFGKNGMEEYCHKNPKLLCPITMICCGYENKCDPKNCPIKEGFGINLCEGVKNGRIRE